MKKSLKKQAVFPVLMLLVVTALALVGSSFAWFSVANQASVGTITGTAENGGVGLMISDQYDGTFSGEITMSTSADHFILPKYLKQLSSADAVHFFAADIKSKNADNTVATIQSKAFSNYSNGTAEGQTTNTDGSVDGTVGYIDFTVYLQVEQAAYLFLQTGSEFVVAAPQGAAQGTQPQNGAFRIAIGTPVAVASTYTGETGPQSTVFNKIYGDQQETNWYPIAADSTDDESPAVTFDAYSQVTTYSPNKKDVDAFSTIVNTDSVISTFSEMTADQATTYKSIGELAVGVNAITFRVWLEGNDPDCKVEVALNRISLTLSFYACKQKAA